MPGSTLQGARRDFRFEHELARDEKYEVRIKSTCKRCGAYKMVSAANQTLSLWESGHQCDVSKRRSAQPGERG